MTSVTDDNLGLAAFIDLPTTEVVKCYGCRYPYSSHVHTCATTAEDMLASAFARETLFAGKLRGAREGAKPVDMVNRPPHYTTGKIEVIDFILDQDFGYLDGQVIKYVSRFKHKGEPLQDLKKARFYLDRLIAAQETE